jgi:hypothetical protein
MPKGQDMAMSISPLLHLLYRLTIHDGVLGLGFRVSVGVEEDYLNYTFFFE